jgi:hypothetical protein
MSGGRLSSHTWLAVFPFMPLPFERKLSLMKGIMASAMPLMSSRAGDRCFWVALVCREKKAPRFPASSSRRRRYTGGRRRRFSVRLGPDVRKQLSFFLWSLERVKGIGQGVLPVAAGNTGAFFQGG